MAGSSSSARSIRPYILWKFTFRFPKVFLALLTSCLRLLSAGYSVTSPGLGRARVCVTGGPGIWDAIPPHDDEADKFEDALLRFKVESFLNVWLFVLLSSSEATLSLHKSKGRFGSAFAGFKP